MCYLNHFSNFPKSIEVVANTVGVWTSISKRKPKRRIEKRKRAIRRPVKTLGVKYMLI